MIRVRPAILLPATLVAAAVLATATPAAADESLLRTDSFVVVAVPAPGHANEWELTAANVSDGPVAVSALVSSVEGAVFDGSHPLALRATAPDRTDLRIPATGSAGSATPLGIVEPGETIRVTGEIALPRDAGDDYQGLSGSATIRLIGEDVTPPSADGALATTGVEVAGTAIVATALLGAGLVLFLSRRRRRRSGAAVTATPVRSDHR